MTETSFADYFKSPTTTYWRAGEAAETAWGVIANHGGGYTFRLCEVASFDPVDIIGAVTEACFQANPLDFDGSTQWVQYLDKVDERVPVTPILVTGNDVKPTG